MKTRTPKHINAIKLSAKGGMRMRPQNLKGMICVAFSI